MKRVSVLLFVFFSLGLAAQSVQNLQATFLDGRAVITYSITGTLPNQFCTIELLASHNNFSTALSNVSGDVGERVAAGANKKMVWDAATALGEFEGDITFRVRARLLPVTLTLTSAPTRVRRGKSLPLSWYGTNQLQPIKVELKQGTNPPIAVASTQGKTTVSWVVPKNFKTGAYTLMVSTAAEKTERPLSVRARVPFLVKLLPVFAVGALVISLGRNEPATNNDLPAPPEPR